MVRNVFGHHTAGGHHGEPPDTDAVQDDGPRADAASFLQHRQRVVVQRAARPRVPIVHEARVRADEDPVPHARAVAQEDPGLQGHMVPEDHISFHT